MGYRSTIGKMLVVYHSIVERELTDRNVYLRHLSVDYHIGWHISWWSADMSSETWHPTHCDIWVFILLLLDQPSIEAQWVMSNVLRSIYEGKKNVLIFVIFLQGFFAFKFSYLTWKSILKGTYSLMSRPWYRPLSRPIYRLMYLPILDTIDWWLSYTRRSIVEVSGNANYVDR